MYPWVIHRNTKDWGAKPWDFDPDRFSNQNCAGRDPFAYIPFSAGNRNCIGQSFAMMEEKAVLAILLKKFNFHNVPDHPIIPEPHVILRPKFGIKVTITPR